MKSVILTLFVSLLCSRFTAGAAIAPLPAIQAISKNNSLLAGVSDAHCSTDYASYGQLHPDSFICSIALGDFMQTARISTLSNRYPMEFVSSTAQLPTTGNPGFRTPWRSIWADCTVAIALLSEVPARFTPEIPATPSGQTATASKGALLEAFNALRTCLEFHHGTKIGWAQARAWKGPGEVAIFSFKTGSPLDQALPDGPRVPGPFGLVADLTAE